MMLKDLFAFIRYYLKLIIVLPLACANTVVSNCLVLLPARSVEATMSAGGNTTLARGYAKANAVALLKNDQKAASLKLQYVIKVNCHC